MGNPKLKWTAEEEEALRAGVAKHGAGKWKHIQRDPEFIPLLSARSNIDLKDKWRNLSVANGTCPREKPKPSKQKAETSAAGAAAGAAAPVPAVQRTPAVVAPMRIDPPRDAVVADSSSKSATIEAAKLNAMIFEAVSALKLPNGCESGVIASFIEGRYEVPPLFRRHLSNRLRRLVQQDKLEKVSNCFMMKRGSSLETRNPTTIQQFEPQPKPFQSFVRPPTNILEEAAYSAIDIVADAEDKAAEAAQAVELAERVSAMEDEANLLLEIATYYYEECALGEIQIVV